MKKTNNEEASQSKKPSSSNYNSNPFTLSFAALGRFFNTNVGWAIALIIMGILGIFAQITGDIGRMIADSNSSTDITSSNINTDAIFSNNPDASVIVAIAIIIFTVVLLIIVIGTIVQTFINGMFSHVALKSEEGKSASFSEAFQETTKRFWRLLLAQILADLKILAWSLLFIIPGIIAAYRYQLLPYLIMKESSDEKGVVGAHQKVKTLVKGRLWELFGISVVAGIIPFVGSILGLSGKAALYNQLRATEKDPSIRPNIHWLNFVGLMLIILLLILVGLIVVIAVSVSSTVKN